MEREQAPRPVHWARNRALILGLSLGSVLLTLFVAEVVLRFVTPRASHHLMYVRSDDPLLGVELRPGADFEFDGLDRLIRSWHSSSVRPGRL